MGSTENKKVLVVFGATGLQGGSIIEQILSDPKASSLFSIRGITRDPTKPAAKALTAKGVDCVAVCQLCSPKFAETELGYLMVDTYLGIFRQTSRTKHHFGRRWMELMPPTQ